MGLGASAGGLNAFQKFFSRLPSDSGMAFGPAAGLEIANALLSEPSLKSYHLLPSVRADFLAKLGRFEEARQEVERAASLTQNTRERALLLARAATWARET